jgi:hypothetical protein
MPWAESSDPKPKPRSATGSHPSRSTPKKKSSSKGSFFSWLQPQDKEKKIETVNDFLSLPPVPYE